MTLGILLGIGFLLGSWAGGQMASKAYWREGVLQGYTYAQGDVQQSQELQQQIVTLLRDNGLPTYRRRRDA